MTEISRTFKYLRLGLCLLICPLAGMVLNAGDTPYHESVGYGTSTDGGITGTVIRVSNLNDGGPGSFRAACEASGKRLVVFEVGGVIDLDDSTIIVTEPFLTVAGQTAPAPGITLIKGNLTIRTHDVVIQHIAVRPGDACVETDAIASGGPEADVYNLVFDHCSATWATDENLSLVNQSDNHDITLYKCLIAEGLNFEDHSCGSLIYGSISNLSIIGCLYAHNVRRNPRINAGTEFLLANNVFYNWGSFSDNAGDYANCVHLRGARGSVCGNFVLGGTDTRDLGNGLYFVRGHDGRYRGEAWFEDNLVRHADGVSPVGESDSLITRLEEKPLWPENFEAKPLPESVENVLQTVGARAGDRDATDARIVGSVINRSGGIIGRQGDVEGYPDYPMTSRQLLVPDGAEQRRAWLDSISASIDTDEDLDVSPLYPILNTVGINDTRSTTTDGLRMHVWPNPAGKTVTIRYSMSKPDRVSLKVFDGAGRELQCLINGHRNPGEYTVKWKTEGLPPGIYQCRLQAGNRSVSAKLILPR